MLRNVGGVAQCLFLTVPLAGPSFCDVRRNLIWLRELALRRRAHARIEVALAAAVASRSVRADLGTSGERFMLLREFHSKVPLHT